MQLFRDYQNCPESAKRAVVALGNFDGFHAGHQAVVAEAKRLAGVMGAKLAVLTFAPHPRQFFDPLHVPLAIYPMRTKLQLLSAAGVEIVYALRFNSAFAHMDAETFLSEVLATQLGVRHVVTGGHFAFGRGRGGDAELLSLRARKLGFGYTRIEPLLDAGHIPCSSTRIREALSQGNIQDASGLLTRPYVIEGHVRHGDARGRQLGFPTANIGVEHIFKPAYGVYAARVTLPDGRITPGVANLGTRPTVDGGIMPLLEVHCFDTNADLYGQRLRVQMKTYMREERTFESVDILKMQIAQDCMQARGIA